MLIILHCCFLGKIATGGVAAERAVLNITMNSSIGFASLLKNKQTKQNPKKAGWERRKEK